MFESVKDHKWRLTIFSARKSMENGKFAHVCYMKIESATF